MYKDILHYIKFCTKVLKQSYIYNHTEYKYVCYNKSSNAAHTRSKKNKNVL